MFWQPPDQHSAHHDIGLNRSAGAARHPPGTGPNRPALQRYRVRSQQSWGIGDLTDAWPASQHDADYVVLITPLRASTPAIPIESSGYLPTARRFIINLNRLHIDVEAIPEFSGLKKRGRVQELRTEVRHAPVDSALATVTAYRWPSGRRCCCIGLP